MYFSDVYERLGRHARRSDGDGDPTGRHLLMTRSPFRNGRTGVFGAATIRGVGLDPGEVLIRLDRDGIPEDHGERAGSDPLFRG